MKLSFSLLKKYLNTDLTFVQILDILGSIGFEVENFKQEENFVIVEIVSVVRHENSDHLQICNVSDQGGIIQVVCGAKNPYVGMKTVLAKVGALMPSGTLIKESKIRGIVSYGMLCSEKELGLEESVNGIIDLKEVGDEDIGAPFFDAVAELSITPNRGYALSIIGIARDLAAAGAGKFVDFLPIDDSLIGLGSCPKSGVEVVIDDEEKCFFYAHRTICGLKNRKSPYWLCRILEGVGIRPINVVVDALSYITLLYGQPMHAYDLKKLCGNIKVGSFAKSKFIAINNKEYVLDEGILVISDKKEVQAVAGIIGGRNSECSLETTDVFLEAAIFSHIDVMKSGRKIGINTDARYRFEHMVDPNFTLPSLEAAAKIISDICGGEVSDVEKSSSLPRKSVFIKFNYEYFKSFTGLQIALEEIMQILDDLGFKILQKLTNQRYDMNSSDSHPVGMEEDLSVQSNSEGEFYVKVPSWMHGIDSMECLIGEVIRIYGYDKIGESPLLDSKPYVYHKSNEDIARDFLAMKGYVEVITWSFVDSSTVENDADFILKNPIAKNLDIMRPSIIPSLLNICSENFAKGIQNVSIFELGTIFKMDENGNILEHDVVSGLRAGMTEERNIYGIGHDINFFDIKSDVVALMEYFQIKNYKIISHGSQLSKYLHPNSQAAIYIASEMVGFLGEVNPRISEKNIAFFEISVAAIVNRAICFKEENSSIYQRVIRDFSFVLPPTICVGEIMENIRNVEKSLITNVRMFDLYNGGDVLGGKTIMGFELTLQSDERTLSGEDIENVSNKVIEIVKDKFGGILRRDYIV